VSAQACSKRRYYTIRWTPRLVRTNVRKRFNGKPAPGIGCVVYLAVVDVLVPGLSPVPGLSRGRGDLARRVRRGGNGELAAPRGRRASARRPAAKGRRQASRRRRKGARKCTRSDSIWTMTIREIRAGNGREKPGRKARTGLTGRKWRDSVVVYLGNGKYGKPAGIRISEIANSLPVNALAHRPSPAPFYARPGGSR
jgi:hypothetical protein